MSFSVQHSEYKNEKLEKKIKHQKLTVYKQMICTRLEFMNVFKNTTFKDKWPPLRFWLFFSVKNLIWMHFVTSAITFICFNQN